MPAVSFVWTCTPNRGMRLLTIARRNERGRRHLAGQLLRTTLYASCLALCGAAYSQTVAECKELREAQHMVVASAALLDSGAVERSAAMEAEMANLYATLTGMASWQDIAEMDQLCGTRLADGLLHFSDVYREWKR